MAYPQDKTIIGKIEKAEPYKPGGKLLRVIINGREFRAFDQAYTDKVGVESEWSYYTKENEWNGRRELQDYLADIVPKTMRPQYGAKTRVPGFSRSKHTIDDVYDLVLELKEAILAEDIRVENETDGEAHRI